METSLADQLKVIQTNLIVYYMPIIYIFGIISNLINTAFSCRRTFRSNPCAIYFICLSLDHIVMLNTACLVRIIATSSGYDTSAHEPIFCKIRGYLYVLTTILSRHFICLIAIDRWLVSSSNVWFRQQSSHHKARRIALSSLLFWCLSLVY